MFPLCPRNRTSDLRVNEYKLPLDRLREALSSARSTALSSRADLSGIGEGTGNSSGPGCLRFPKKPFVAKATRYDLSTVQVLVHICRVYFCLGVRGWLLLIFEPPPPPPDTAIVPIRLQ